MAVKPGQLTQVALERAGNDALSDKALVARMASGDGDAFAVLVKRHVGSISGIARRMLGDDSEVDDVAQEAFLKLWRLGAGLTIDDNGVRPWLRRVVSNLSIDRIRARRRTDVRDELPEVAVAAEQLKALEGDVVAERVDHALQALPERQRQALTLFHFEEMSQREIAACMDISDEAVESLLARARRGLKATLADEWRELMTSSGAE